MADALRARGMPETQVVRFFRDAQQKAITVRRAANAKFQTELPQRDGSSML